MDFTQKENNMLQDLKSKEELCVKKYNKYSQEASDTKLKDLFAQIGQKEQQHLDTINQIISGTVPAMNQSSGGQQASQQMQSQNMGMGNTKNTNQMDNYLCTDTLDTEKHVSSAYNTSIFEFTNKDVRNTLNHIQKEEQEHGEQIYNYMSQNGMY